MRGPSARGGRGGGKRPPKNWGPAQSTRIIGPAPGNLTPGELFGRSKMVKYVLTESRTFGDVSGPPRVPGPAESQRPGSTCHQTCHWRVAGKMVLGRDRPRTKGHSVIPAPRTNSVGTCRPGAETTPFTFSELRGPGHPPSGGASRQSCQRV